MSTRDDPRTVESIGEENHNSVHSRCQSGAGFLQVNGEIPDKPSDRTTIPASRRRTLRGYLPRFNQDLRGPRIETEPQTTLPVRMKWGVPSAGASRR